MKTIISVVIPTHNRMQLLKRAVESVLTQTYQQFELIIVDDASSDETKNYLASLAATSQRIKVITNDKSLGGSQSRNLGIAASCGEWIAFLDDDDMWLPEKLEKQMKALKKFPESVACSANYRVNYPLQIKKIIHTPTSITLEKLLNANVLGGASVCICRADVLKGIGSFDGKLRSAQDWDIWVRLRKCGKIISVPEVLVEYYVHFNTRISNDMRAKYIGARRFYFKYQAEMKLETRINNVAFLCFIKSRQSFRPWRVRLRYLILAMKNSSFRQARAYGLSSFPRLMLTFSRR